MKVYTLSNLINFVLNYYLDIFGIVLSASGGILGIIRLKARRSMGFLVLMFSIILVAVSVYATYACYSGKYTKVELQPEIYGSNTYFGQSNNGRPNGYGKMYDGNKRIIYEGYYKDGEKHGTGKEYIYVKDSSDSPCFIYDGEYSNGLRNGEFTVTRKDDSIEYISYFGGYSDDKYSGYGVYNYHDADGWVREKGYYVDGELNGICVIEYVGIDEVGYVYVGNMKNGNPFGDGVLYYYDGTVCKQGDFKTEEKDEGVLSYNIETEKELEGEYPFPYDCIFTKNGEGILCNNEDATQMFSPSIYDYHLEGK